MQVRGRADIDLIIHARLKVPGNKPWGHRKSVRTIDIIKKCDRTSKKLAPSFQSQAFPLSPPRPSSLTSQNLPKLKYG